MKEWRDILAVWSGLCAYCGATGASVDHMIPIARGGTHDKDNVVPACNSSKRDVLPLDFILAWRRAA